MSDGGIERDDYTWDHAAKDLALMSPLTLREAGHFCDRLRTHSTLHPYDALPLLRTLVTAESWDARGSALGSLLNLA